MELIICNPKLLNIAGLTFNLIGFILILLYGIPSKFVDPRYARSSQSSMFEETNMSTLIHKAHRDKHNKSVSIKNYIGVIFNIIGLLIQIIANLLL